MASLVHAYLSPYWPVSGRSGAEDIIYKYIIFYPIFIEEVKYIYTAPLYSAQQSYIGEVVVV